MPSEEQIVEIKKQMIGSDLILVTELDEDSPSYLSDYSDGSIFSMCCAPGGRIGDGYRGFAEEGDGSRCMLELCSFALSDQGYIPISDALAAARRGGCRIVRDGAECRFSHKRLGEVRFLSLEKIRATLEDMHEYGFMGISIDLMRTPQNFLMMYNSYFGASPYSCVGNN